MKLTAPTPSAYSNRFFVVSKQHEVDGEQVNHMQTVLKTVFCRSWPGSMLQYSGVLHYGCKPPRKAKPLRGNPFKKATDLACSDDLLYCEGWRLLDGARVPLPHAWCQDPNTGEVIDPEAPTRGNPVYLGLSMTIFTVFKIQYVTDEYGAIFRDDRRMREILVEDGLIPRHLAMLDDAD